MIKTIKNEICKLINTYKTTNPVTLCDLLGYNLIFCDLPDCQNGFYINIHGKKTIVINNNCPAEFKDFYIAHEIGHSILHEKANYYFICESTNLVCGKFEREADLFAACLLTYNRHFFNESLTKQDLSFITGIPYYVIDNVVCSCS